MTEIAWFVVGFTITLVVIVVADTIVQCQTAGK